MFDLYDAGALHLRCTTCGTEEDFYTGDDDLDGPHGLAIALDRVIGWAAGHVEDCRGTPS